MFAFLSLLGRPSHQHKLSTSSDGSKGSSIVTIVVDHPTFKIRLTQQLTWNDFSGSQLHGDGGYSTSPLRVNFTFDEVQIPHHTPPIPMHASKPGLNSQITNSLANSKFEPFRRPSGPPTKIPTPAERAKARIEAEREKEFETCLAVQEEEERQARIKAEKEELCRQEEEEEAHRKAKLEQDIRLAQLLRKQREHDQAKADEKFAQEVEERRRANKEKRLQGYYKSQAWRIEQERSKEKTLHKKEEEKRREEEVKMQERKRVFNAMKAEHSDRLQLSGWMSVQAAGTVTWRRRWYTFDENSFKFFKDQNVCYLSSCFLFTDDCLPGHISCGCHCHLRYPRRQGLQGRFGRGTRVHPKFIRHRGSPRMLLVLLHRHNRRHGLSQFYPCPC